MLSVHDFEIQGLLEQPFYIYNPLWIAFMAQWLSWLERRPVTAEVKSSSLFWVVFLWNLSSAGRASALQAEGHRFEPRSGSYNGPMVKRLRHRPFTAVLWVQIPLGSLVIIVFQSYADVAQLAEQLICNQQVNGSSPLIGS